MEGGGADGIGRGDSFRDDGGEVAGNRGPGRLPNNTPKTRPRKCEESQAGRGWNACGGVRVGGGWQRFSGMGSGGMAGGGFLWTSGAAGT